MKINRDVQAGLGINFLSEKQLEELHLATLNVLERVGVDIYHEEVLEILDETGAKIRGKRAYIPSALVEEILNISTPRVTLNDRHGSIAMELEKQRIYFGTGSDTPNFIDLDTGERRKACKDDIKNAVQVAHELNHIDFVMSMGLAKDVPEKKSDVHHFEAMVKNTDKPIIFTAHDREGLEKIIDIAAIVKNGQEELEKEPFIALYDEPSSPLSHSKEALEKLLCCAEYNLPVIYAPAVMSGATGPVTQAGGVVVANAEILSGLVIHQLKSRGAPFIFGGGVPPLDMETSICSYGDPRRDLGCASLVRLAQFYDLPVFTTAGASDAQKFDQQAGMEAGFNLLMAGLTGGNLIHDLGYIGVGMTYSLEMLILCNEAAAIVKRLLSGYEINEKTMALDVIEEVGPGGEFITHQHTLENFRAERPEVNLLNRKNYDSWQRNGGHSFGEKANELAKKIVDEGNQARLPDATLQEIERTMQETKQPSYE